jgi:uncharacterized protein YuzE
MKISYDKTVDAKYVTIKSGKVSITKPLNEWLFLDLNVKGQVLGVEILDASKNVVHIYTDGKDVTRLNFEENVSLLNLNNVPRIAQEKVQEFNLAYA